MDDRKEFEEIYQQKLKKHKKKWVAYCEAEWEFKKRHGRRKYSSWGSHRVTRHRLNKK